MKGLSEMEDPLKGRLNLDAAEEALGIDDETRPFYKISASVRLILQRLGITDDEVQAAYEHDLVNQLKEVSASLDGMVRGGLDARE